MPTCATGLENVKDNNTPFRVYDQSSRTRARSTGRITTVTSQMNIVGEFNEGQSPRGIDTGQIYQLLLVHSYDTTASENAVIVWWTLANVHCVYETRYVEHETIKNKRALPVLGNCQDPGAACVSGCENIAGPDVKLSYPKGLAADYAKQTYYVADTGNERLLSFKWNDAKSTWKVTVVLAADSENAPATYITFLPAREAIFFYSTQDNRVYKVGTTANAQPEFVAGNTRIGQHDGMGAEALFTNNVKMLQTMQNGNVLVLDSNLIRVIDPATNIVATLGLQGAYSIATVANNAQEKGMILYSSTNTPPTMTQLQQLNTVWAHDMDQLYEHPMMSIPLQLNQRIVQIAVKTPETLQASYDTQIVILTNDGKVYPHKMSLCNYGMVWNGQNPIQSCTRLPCERNAACSALEVPATGSNVCQCKPGMLL
eukprot:2255844-Rhodomonas_salina.1